MNALNTQIGTQIGTQTGDVRPFTRVIVTPAAFPWDQARAAQLEARHTSPVMGVAGFDLTIVVKRLGPWRLREAGRFAAVYLKGGVPPQGLSFTIDVQGRPVKVDIASKASQASEWRRRAWAIAAAAIVTLSLAFQVGVTLQRRAHIEDRLAQIAPQIQRARTLNAGLSRTRQNAAALAELEMAGRTVDDVVDALRTVTVSKDPGARIDAFLWDGGDWALEVRGDAPPLKTGSVDLQKAPKPVRRGVNLWVHVAPQSVAAPESGPDA